MASAPWRLAVDLATTSPTTIMLDDVDMARLRRIDLTTVSQPRDTLVRLGVETLLGRIEERITGEPHVTLASVTLKIRGSTAPAP